MNNLIVWAEKSEVTQTLADRVPGGRALRALGILKPLIKNRAMFHSGGDSELGNLKKKTY